MLTTCDKFRPTVRHEHNYEVIYKDDSVKK